MICSLSAGVPERDSWRARHVHDPVQQEFFWFGTSQPKHRHSHHPTWCSSESHGAPPAESGPVEPRSGQRRSAGRLSEHKSCYRFSEFVSPWRCCISAGQQIYLSMACWIGLHCARPKQEETQIEIETLGLLLRNILLSSRKVGPPSESESK